ncbi:MAG: MgtC/SapB family protein [Bacteroidales bacterium]|jgi:putative Mg2+ transporter-C (MgtC) family protein|nr:MgtC/SapB family protein [Bacteroidales bacterium]
METDYFIIRLAVAMLAGMIIGFEREWRLRTAGLLTNTLVAVGAAVYVITSEILTQTSGDPSRVLGQIATGIGFLGAGVIMRDGFNIHGLNSAATIWCSAAIGALAGFGFTGEACIAAGFVVLINIIVRQEALFVSRLSLRKKKVTAGVSARFYLEETAEAGFRVFLMEALQSYPMLILRSFQSGKTSFFPSSREFVCEILFDKTQEDNFRKFITSVSQYPHIQKLHQEAVFLTS